MPQALSHRASATISSGETPIVRSDEGGLSLRLITPEGLGGGGGEGLSAEAILAAGYAACFRAALGYAATLRGEALPADVQVSASVEVSKSADDQRFDADIVVEAAVPSLGADAQALVEAARELWPYADGAQPITVRLAGGGAHETSMEARAEAAEGRGYGG